jgi:CO/xanthine dehydrogenase Mo-binding subunit
MSVPICRTFRLATPTFLHGTLWRANLYRPTHVYVNVKAVFHQYRPVDAYRALGVPRPMHSIERIIDMTQNWDRPG